MPKLSYTQSIEPFELEVDGEAYWLLNPAPADLITELAKIADIDSTVAKIDAISTFLGKAMLPNSRKAFRARCAVPSEEDEQAQDAGAPAGPPPIGFELLIKILEDVLDQYTEGIRPTEDPSGSPDGSETTGSSSTEPAPSEVESTPETLASPGA